MDGSAVEISDAECKASNGNVYNCLKNCKIVNQAGLEELSFDENGVLVDEKKWFVMRDLKRHNAKLPGYKLLEKENIEVFTPMRKVPVMRQGRKTYQELPFIQDLFFAHSKAENLDPILQKNPTIQYRYVRGKKYREPMTVSHMEMETFMQAVNISDSLRYYRPDELNPAMYGRRIRIVGGPLDNYEGFLLKGLKKKVILVSLQGFLTVGVEVSPEYIQFI